jgi:hypothetical protein
VQTEDSIYRNAADICKRGADQNSSVRGLDFNRRNGGISGQRKV